GVRLLLGLTDSESVKWDGEASLRGGALQSIEPWRFEGSDAISGTSWTASTHPARLFGGGRLVEPQVVANGVILWIDQADESAEIAVKTAQGNFTFRLADIPYGASKKLLNDRVLVDRIPPIRRLTTRTDEEDDVPSLAVGPDGTVWLAYLIFLHH